MAIDEVDAILEGDLQAKLPQEVREAMLDVVLAWANLDMATAFFVSLVSELDPDDGAKKFGRKQIEEKLARAGKILAENKREELAEEVREIAESYQEKSFYRRRIAHSKCAGVRKTNPRRVVFLPYEQEGPPGNLAVEIFALDFFTEAITWARSAHDTLMKYVDDADYFGVRKQ